MNQNYDIDAMEKATIAMIVSLVDPYVDPPDGFEVDQSIPESGVLDSRAVLELVIWFEQAYELEIPDKDITQTNLGTIKRMITYAWRQKKLGDAYP
jgi:D-alanine--poly(phosphoribitol) ligase subunit 2